ncbi:alcohol dehydrogenase catalytic domain-containing protein [Kineococcus sp. NUM-3379]
MSAVDTPRDGAPEGTMRAAVWTGPDRVEARRVPVPQVPDGWALVRTELTGLCGSDFSILHGTHPRAAAPLVMGHETVGTVVTAAPGGPAAGTRVVVEPLITCGTCRPCTSGSSHVCRHLGLYGIDAPGSLAELVALPADRLVPVGPHVPVREAALAEPLAVAVHAVARAGLRGGERVAVFGAGPIGVLTALVARHAGAQVLVAEPSAPRRAVATALGFAVADPADPLASVLAATGGDGADVVFDSAAHPAVAALLPRAARVQGTVVLVGVYKRPVEVDLQAVGFAELTLVGVRVYTRADVERAVDLLESGVLGLDRVPVEVFALEDTDLAFGVAMSAGAVLKVLVSPDEAPRARGAS